MMGLRTIALASAALLLSASPSVGLALPDAVSQEVIATSEPLLFKGLNLTEALPQFETSSHRLGKRQYASGSQTPLWYTGRTDPWASFSKFNWNTWINWGWSDHTLGYVK
jgi:hypothetical protein